MIGFGDYYTHMEVGFVHQFNRLTLDTLVYIPNPFLFKPRRARSESCLDSENFQLSLFLRFSMKNHPRKGFKLLSSIVECITAMVM